MAIYRQYENNAINWNANKESPIASSTPFPRRRPRLHFLAIAQMRICESPGHSDRCGRKMPGHEKMFIVIVSQMGCAPPPFCDPAQGLPSEEFFPFHGSLIITVQVICQPTEANSVSNLIQEKTGLS
jgi:hypothetical protein